MNAYEHFTKKYVLRDAAWNTVPKFSVTVLPIKNRKPDPYGLYTYNDMTDKPGIREISEIFVSLKHQGVWLGDEHHRAFVPAEWCKYLEFANEED